MDAIDEANLVLPFNDYYIFAAGYSPALKNILPVQAIHPAKSNRFNVSTVTLTTN